MHVRVHATNWRASCAPACGLSCAPSPHRRGPISAHPAQPEQSAPLCLLGFALDLGPPLAAASAWRKARQSGAQEARQFVACIWTYIQRTPECARVLGARSAESAASGSPSLWLLSLGEAREGDPFGRRPSGSIAFSGEWNACLVPPSERKIDFADHSNMAAAHEREPMKHNASARELLGPDGPFAREVPNFTPRDCQQIMAEAVEEAIADGHSLIAEAGTGTGKTFAYLVPALLSGKRVIVSTGTKTLQDQLFHRDLPRVRGVLGARL